MGTLGDPSTPRRLDRSRPFGTVFGGGPLRYEQDGALFDHQEFEILPAVATPGPEPIPVAVTPAPEPEPIIVAVTPAPEPEPSIFAGLPEEPDVPLDPPVKRKRSWLRPAKIAEPTGPLPPRVDFRVDPWDVIKPVLRKLGCHATTRQAALLWLGKDRVIYNEGDALP